VSESSGYTYTYSMAHIMLMQSIEWKLDEKHLLIVWPICRKETRKLWVVQNAFTAREIKKRSYTFIYNFE